jgi:translation initiation factor 5
MALNVNRSVQDAFYRYKMPRLQAKVEGKGNGIKTVVVNMVDIARSLDRPPTYVTKYFGCELGAQTQFDIKAERYIVNGCHDAAKMQDMLDGFIKRFVLCEKCDNPETVLKVKKNMIGAACKACGHIFTIDMRHKLTTYIVKNPPEKDIDAQGSSQTKKKDRAKEKEDKSKKTGSDGDAEDDDWGEDETEWIEDTSDEAIAKRAQEQLTSGISGLVIDSDMDKSEEERVNIFFKFVQVKKGLINGPVSKEILAEAERLEIKNKAPVILCELLFNDKMFKEKQIKKYSNLLLRFTTENPKGQKYLIGGIEKTVETFEASLLPKVAHIFKELYEEDILEEKVILEWATKVSKKNVSKEMAQKIHDKAAPFIKWLKEAEEESEESSDDGVEIEYDDRAKISKLKEANVPEKKEASPDVSENKDDSEDGNDDDDVDIDDI